MLLPSYHHHFSSRRSIKSNKHLFPPRKFRDHLLLPSARRRLMPTMTLSFFLSRYLDPFRRYQNRMSRSLSISLACAAAAAGASHALAFVAPRTSHVPTLQSRPSSSAVPRTMPAHTIMGVATSASATLLTDMTTTASTSGLAEIDDGNFQELFGGEKAVLIDACAPVS